MSKPSLIIERVLYINNRLLKTSYNLIASLKRVLHFGSYLSKTSYNNVIALLKSSIEVTDSSR